MVAGNPRHTLKFKLDIIEPYMEKSLLKKTVWSQINVQPVNERGPAGSGGKSTASKREQIWAARASILTIVAPQRPRTQVPGMPKDLFLQNIIVNLNFWIYIICNITVIERDEGIYVYIGNWKYMSNDKPCHWFPLFTNYIPICRNSIFAKVSQFQINYSFQ